MKPKYHFRPNGELIVIPDGDDWYTTPVEGTWKKQGRRWLVCSPCPESQDPSYKFKWDHIFDETTVPSHIRAMALLFT